MKIRLQFIRAHFFKIIYDAIALNLQISVYRLHIILACQLHGLELLCMDFRIKFNFYKFFFKQLTLLYRLIGSADHGLLTAVFYFKASRGHCEHLFVNVEVVVVNPNVVEISASSKKHTYNVAVILLFKVCFFHDADISTTSTFPKKCSWCPLSA